MMATTLQEILERCEHEYASTHAVIAAMPEAYASFRPHERSLSWAQLAWHVATTPLYYVSEVFKLPTQSGWDLDSVNAAVRMDQLHRLVGVNLLPGMRSDSTHAEPGAKER
jgi:hypothetical protein